jgi:hypothetical protein
MGSKAFTALPENQEDEVQVRVGGEEAVQRPAEVGGVGVHGTSYGVHANRLAQALLDVRAGAGDDQAEVDVE